MYFSSHIVASLLIALCLISIVSTSPLAAHQGSKGAVNTTTCNGKKYVYEELAGYGYLPSNGRDKAGDTLGGLGSSIAMDKKSWRKVGKSYKGLLYALPDRGWYV